MARTYNLSFPGDDGEILFEQLKRIADRETKAQEKRGEFRRPVSVSEVVRRACNFYVQQHGAGSLSDSKG